MSVTNHIHANKANPFAGSREASQGFTLVELMVVVAIIAILASIGIPKMVNFIRASQASEATQQIGRIAAGLKAYADLNPTKTDPSGKILSPVAAKNNLTKLIPAIVIDDTAKFDYKVEAFAAGGATFCISAISRATDDAFYVLYSKTEVSGWNGSFNTSDYILKTPKDTVTVGGDCIAVPSVTVQ